VQRSSVEADARWCPEDQRSCRGDEIRLFVGWWYRPLQEMREGEGMYVLRIVAVIAAVLIIFGVLWDAFESVVLPRRVSRHFRLARAYYRTTWHAWRALARQSHDIERRENLMGIYGPLALLLLLALWVALLIVGYALLLWGFDSPLAYSALGNGGISFGTDLYFSGTTFLTLGLGDVFPNAISARMIAVIEVGTGFAVLALVIGYLPILYQAFSRREQRISLLDAHAGSPPTAGALLLRHPRERDGRQRRLTALLAEWEGWSAELLETHLSYPILAYYRSQHEDQSWAAALAVIMDVCALVLACGRGLLADEETVTQAAFTFAMARHAAVDLAQVFNASTSITTPHLRNAAPLQASKHASDGRLPPEERARLRNVLMSLGDATGAEPPAVANGDGAGSIADKMHNSVSGTLHALDELRALYEPYLHGLADWLLMDLPPWVPGPGALDDWQTTADGITAPSVTTRVEQQRARHGGRAAHTGTSVAPGHLD
jgi:hypothetical protein